MCYFWPLGYHVVHILAHGKSHKFADFAMPCKHVEKIKAIFNVVTYIMCYVCGAGPVFFLEQKQLAIIGGSVYEFLGV